MNWLSIANKKYPSKKEAMKYQKTVSKDKFLSEEEQDWIDAYLSPLIDFMGDEDVWISIIPHVKVQGAQERNELKQDSDSTHVK